MPNYGGTPLDWLHKDLDFEVAIYGLLQNAPGIPTDRLLHYRYPLQHTEVKHGMPKDITGRWLTIFEIAQGERQLWLDLDQRQRMSTLANAAKIHAALLKLELPRKFVNEWLLSRNLHETGETSITSVFGWEAGTIVPLVLSEVMFVNEFLLTIDEYGKPATLPLSSNLSRPEEWDKNEKYNAEFLKTKKWKK
ncbi:hypothetical protein CEP51_002571 [Fusarium floridanum]|uniref:Uncharacterized protein n=1 Tax=Fusarium floridanum TaxID=1325733 RepID=A0A428SAK8_9HYPO|nr:hypothetical protein CEP51_002571 [Fusarium floridanum]